MLSAARALVLGTGLLLAVPGVAADAFARGLSAYDVADDKDACDVWYPLADDSDPKAQAAVAFSCLKGLGVRQDDVRAADWYRGVARPEAQFFLDTMYYLGRVPRNDQLAHVWCEAALAGGMTPGQDCRDAASARMTQSEVREAYRIAADWLERRGGQ